jgi:hypothetical protein
MDDKMHKFEILFQSLDSAPWRKELEQMFPKNRYIVEPMNTSVRHIMIFTTAHEADLARVSVEKFTDHVCQVCRTAVTVCETIGWGSTIPALDA